METTGFEFHQKSSALCQVNKTVQFLGLGGQSCSLFKPVEQKYRGWGLLKWLPFTPKPNSAGFEDAGDPVGSRVRVFWQSAKAAESPIQHSVWWCFHINMIRLFHRAWQTPKSSGMSGSLTNNILLIAHTAAVDKSYINYGQMSYSCYSCLAQCGFSTAPCWGFCLFVFNSTDHIDWGQ